MHIVEYGLRMIQSATREAGSGSSTVQRTTLVHGERTLMTEFRMPSGSGAPLHAHPYEQTGYLVSGRILLTVGDEVRELTAGSSWCVPADCSHGAEVLESAVAIEVFSPVREDYLPSICEPTSAG